MAFLDFFFKKKEDKSIDISSIQNIPKVNNPCGYCKKELFSWEKTTKKVGKRFHRKCYKKLIKEGNKKAFG